VEGVGATGEDSGSAAALKRALRVEASAVRGKAHSALAKMAGPRLADVFLHNIPVEAGLVVAGYWPIREEVDVRPLLHRLDTLGCVIALPVVVARDQVLVFRRWRIGSPLEVGRHGTRHPSAVSPVVLPDLLVVPLLAFDSCGSRLGYGGGYYDRTLAALRAERTVLVVGAAYAAQEMVALPRDGHDQRLDWIVTEKAAQEAPR
jgi:5-formyltetrahydrofolate cyclo-ligase